MSTRMAKNSLSNMEREFLDKSIVKRKVMKSVVLALRLKSELADDVRRRFLRRKPQKLSPPSPAPEGGGRALSSEKKAVAFFAVESCAAHK